ncbi:MAG: extracellular solute-binding protein [Firmicutes bacterium]|nr:extracellular solute-binding protein [Bacillota bacterium]
MKKIISIIAAVSLLAVSLSGCREEKTENDGNIPKITIYMNNGVTTGTSSSSNADIEAVKQKIIEETGVEPVFIGANAGAETEKLNVMLASGEDIDVFWGDWSEYYEKNMIIPLNDLLNKYGKNILKETPNEVWLASTDNDSKIWGIPRVPATLGYPIFIRTDWLKKYNLKMPQTIEELENVMKVFKENDPAGNNTTIPIIIKESGMNHGLSAAFTGNGYGNYFDSSDQKVKPSVLDPKYKDFIETMARWYNLGYINKEGFSMDTSQIREYIKQNKVGIHLEWYSNVTLSTQDLKLNNPEADYEIAEVSSPLGKSETLSTPSQKSMLITKKCKHPEAVIKLVNWAYESVDNYNLLAYGIEGKNWKYTDDNKTDVEILNPDARTYNGECNFALGTMETKAISVKTNPTFHEKYIINNLTDYDRATKVFDYGTVYDTDVIKNEIPMMSDLDRMMDEEIVKFITGIRPMSEWDTFIQDLYSIGLDTYIDVYTKQYNEHKK